MSVRAAGALAGRAARALAGRAARRWRRALAALFALSVLGGGVAVPAAPAAAQVHTTDADFETAPDAVRLAYSEKLTVYMRANDSVTYRLCEWGVVDKNCDEQTATCGVVSQAMERIEEQAFKARTLLIDQGVRDIVESDRVGTDHVRLEHLLEKLQPVLPLRYRFLNPEVDPPDHLAPAQRNDPPIVDQGDPDSYRDPAVTTALLTVAPDDPQKTDDEDIDDYIDTITTVTAFDALPRSVLDRLVDEDTMLTALQGQINRLNTQINNLGSGEQRTTLEEQRDAQVVRRDDLLGGVQEALRVDPDDWPLHVHSTLALLRRYLDRGLGPRPPQSHMSKEDDTRFFVLEDIPFALALMTHARWASLGNYNWTIIHLWPWTSDNWTGGFLAGFLELVGVDQPDVAPMREARVAKKRGTGLLTRPVETVVLDMMAVCNVHKTTGELGVRSVGPTPADDTGKVAGVRREGSSPGDVVAKRAFAPLREPTGSGMSRTVVVDVDGNVLLREPSDLDTWWVFPDTYFADGTNPGFYGVDPTYHTARYKFWWKYRPAGALEGRHVHASYLTLRYDDGGTADDTSDDQWELLADEGGTDIVVHTMDAYDTGGNAVLQEATPWGSGVEPLGVNGALGDWGRGGAIELTGTRLGEVSLQYCVDLVSEYLHDPVCDMDWEWVTVMVEPEGWQDARAWANDDAFRLLVDFGTAQNPSGQVVLLHESAGGSVTLDSRTYDVVERICCVTDELADWSLSLELPVMDNDTVRFFKTPPDPNNVGRVVHRLIDRYGDVVAAANLTASDQAHCLGTRYCSLIRPKAKGGVDSGGFGLAVGPSFTSLKLRVSAPSGGFTATSESRTFDYCLAHRAEDCDTTPATCAVATYVEAPRAPNAPATVAALRTADVPSHHFVARTACGGADGTVTFDIDVYGVANRPPSNVGNVLQPPSTTPPPAPVRKCYRFFKRDPNDPTERAKVWQADWDVDPTKRDAPTWCDLPQRIPADVPDPLPNLPTSHMLAEKRKWHEYAIGGAAPGSDVNPETNQYWTTDESGETDWRTYWRQIWRAEPVPAVRQEKLKLLDQDWLEGCQRNRPADDWPQRWSHDDQMVGSAASRWRSTRASGTYMWAGYFLTEQGYGGDDLILVGFPLALKAAALCEGATPRIVGVWGTHVGADNWILGPDGGSCTWEWPVEKLHDRTCTTSRGSRNQDLGDEWHRRLAAVEPCIGAAECDAWVPPMPGWYQVRIEVVPPAVAMRTYWHPNLPDLDAKFTRNLCTDVGTPPVKQCTAEEVVWGDPHAFVFDDLIWVEVLHLNAG